MNNLLSILCLLLMTAAAAAETTSFTTLFQHPGSKSLEASEVELVLLSNEDGRLEAYTADVDSVICGDGLCEIITVRLTWDPLGEFVRYEFPKGGNLTKKDHEEFTQEDHEKLAEILKNKDSLLSEVSAADIVTPEEALMAEAEDQEVDGTTSATLLSDKSATVPGAVYTCYTLWHWVNSDLQLEIRDLSAEEMGNDELADYLLEGTTDQQLFALETLADRGEASPALRAAAAQLSREGSTEIAAAAIDYLEGLGATFYYPVMADVFTNAPPQKQTLYLMSLASTELEPPAGFLDELSANLARLKGYYETHLMLNLMTAKNSGSEVVINNTVPLLESQSFLIARRAYNFLREEELSGAQFSALETFATNNAERL